MSSSQESVELGGEYWSAQLEVFDALDSGRYDLVVFRTGYGGGKTLLGSDWIHGVAMSVPKSDNLVIAPDSVKGEATTYKRFFDRLPGEDTIPDEGGDPENSPIIEKYHGTKLRLTYINGSIVRLGSADKWNRYAGGEFNAIYCDEPAHYDTTDLYDLHEMLISRQRTAGGPNVTLWTSTGAGYNQYYDITERRIQPDGEGGEEPLPWGDYMRVVVGDSRDNPFHEELEKLTRQFEGTAREAQALEGGFSAPKGLVYKAFTRNTHVIPEAEVPDRIPRDAQPIYGYDAGWDHPRVLVEWYPTHHDQWLATDCYYESEKPFDHLCNPRQQTGWVYENTTPRTTVYCEHEPEHIQKFRQAGFQAIQAKKDLDEGIPYVRGLLEVRGDPPRPGLLVSDRCVELIQEFQSYKEDQVGKSGDVPDHVLDATRYALFTQSNGPEHYVGTW